MRSPDEVHADIEADRSSREGEIRLIQQLLAGSDADAEQKMLKRTLILLTYAHLEGFCKFALLAYAGTINSVGMKCADASAAIAAASLSSVFYALRNSQAKHPSFSRALPDDSKLHLSYREQEFVTKIADIKDLPVYIEDKFVDTESNLKSAVLRKLLFQLGFDYQYVADSVDSDINSLLGLRNAIAHGDRLIDPKDKVVQDYIATAFQVMGFLQAQVFSALQTELYRRPGAA